MTNVALVVLDTVRKDRFDRYLGDLPGRRFERAYTTANWTAPAHASLFTGRYGSEVGVHARSSYFDCAEPALAEVLSRAGYTTRAISANYNVNSRKAFDRGFDEFVDPRTLLNPGQDLFDWQAFLADAAGPRRYLSALAACLRGDCDTLASLRYAVGLKLNRVGTSKRVEDDGARAALQRIRETTFGEDEFLFVNLMEAHTPYGPPAPFRSTDEPVRVTLRDTFEGVDDPDRVRRAYDDAVSYLAHVYEDLFEELSRSFDYVLTLSDHGEMLGERDLWNHTYGLYPPVARVPLVLTETDDPTDDVCPDPVSLLDVHRTVLELADVSASSRGQDLTGAVEPRDRLVEYRGLLSVARDRLAEAGLAPAEIERYDADVSAVVGADGFYAVETDDGFDVTGPAPADERACRERLDALRSSLDVRETGDDGGVDPETRAELERLGYL